MFVFVFVIQTWFPTLFIVMDAMTNRYNEIFGLFDISHRIFICMASVHNSLWALLKYETTLLRNNLF